MRARSSPLFRRGFRLEYTAAQRAHDRRPLGSRFQDTNKQSREGGGLPESEEGEEGCIPPGITHDLVLKFDLPARKAEREERLLAMRSGDVNATLYDICGEGGGKDARFLLAHGADADYLGGAGLALLSRAAGRGRLPVVEALLDAGAGQLGDAFEGGAWHGRTAVVALLLDRGADVNHRNGSALWWAAHEGNLEMVTLLLDRGADPSAHPLWAGMTARKMAQERGHHEVAALLLARGAIN